SATVFFLLFLTLPCHPTSTLFPYTTLFRSRVQVEARRGDRGDAEHDRNHERRPGQQVKRPAVQDMSLQIEHGGPDPHGRQHLDRSEEHTSELQSLRHLVCRLLLEKKKKQHK